MTAVKTKQKYLHYINTREIAAFGGVSLALWEWEVSELIFFNAWVMESQ